LAIQQHGVYSMLLNELESLWSHANRI
jgi:hypothetical protein